MIDNLFLCVGAQKSGTTWLHSQLESHPEVGFSDVKEVHYFNTIHNGSILLTRRKVDHLRRLVENNRGALERYFSDLSRGMPVDAGISRLLSPVDDAWYEKLFETNKKKYCADFSPEYALLPKEGFEHIKKMSRKRKVIFIMRDPVSRAKSAIQYYFQTHNYNYNDIDDKLIRKVMNYDFILKMSMYDKTIQLLRETFDINDLKFMFFEEVMEDKQKSANEVFDFLEVGKVDLVKERSEEVVNKSRKLDMPVEVEEYLREALASTYKNTENLIGYVPSAWKA